MTTQACLLLNASYEPLDIVSWQRAMTLWAQGKVEIVDTHDHEVRAVTFTFKLPSIVRMLHYVRAKRRPHIQFSRANIYARDGYTCQYCLTAFKTEELTFDHVVPVSKGGLRTWENIVTACLDCNRRKANRTPQEADMTLHTVPRKPGYNPIFRLTFGLRKAPESWHDFLYWRVELDNDNAK